MGSVRQDQAGAEQIFRYFTPTDIVRALSGRAVGTSRGGALGS